MSKDNETRDYLSRRFNKKYHCCQMYDESDEEFKQRFIKFINENKITNLNEIEILGEYFTTNKGK